MQKKYYDLVTIYSLRKSLFKSSQTRFGCARVIHNNNVYALQDHTGCLLPVEFSHPNTFQNGDYIEFQGHFIMEENMVGALKYNDHGFKFVILDSALLSQQLLSNSNEKFPPLMLLEPDLEKAIVHDKESSTDFLPLVSQSKWTNLLLKNKAIRRVENFFNNRSFFCTHTPTLVPSGGMESYLQTFRTEYEDHRGKKWQLELPTSPEFALKKYLSNSLTNVYQIARSFRNKGEVSAWHEPEFFMVEWYRLNSDLSHVIDDTKTLVCAISEEIGSLYELPQEWPCFSVQELFLKYLNLDLLQLQNKDDFFKASASVCPSLRTTDDWNDIFCKLFMEFIEPRLKEFKACFVTHYPIQMGALAAVHPNEPFVQRMECYLNGVEICNGYFELTDPVEFERRLKEAQKLNPLIQADEHFSQVLHSGFPPCSGNALGLDRVIAVLLKLNNIQELYPIPFLSQFAQGTVAHE